MTKDRRCSIDAHCQERAGSMSLVLLIPMGANISSTDIYTQLSLRLPKMQDQELMKLHWHSMSGWGSENVAILIASEGSQYLIYGYLQPNAT